MRREQRALGVQLSVARSAAPILLTLFAQGEIGLPAVHIKR